MPSAPPPTRISSPTSSDGPQAYLGLGANLGDRRSAIVAAVAFLQDHGHLSALRLSSLYETDAVADHPQPPYLNAVLRGRATASSAAELLAACLAAEAALGRTRPTGLVRAARSIDVDVLLFGDCVIDTPALTVPHPELLRRPFVRIPLAEVAQAGLAHPVTGEALDVAPSHDGVRLWQAAGSGEGGWGLKSESANPDWHTQEHRVREHRVRGHRVEDHDVPRPRRGGDMSEGQQSGGGGGRLMLERRSGARIPLEMWVEETTENERYFRRAGNLSRGGLRLDHTIPLPPGTVVSLTFTLPGDSTPVTVAGEIVPTRGSNELRMGVKFVNLPSDSQARIDAYLGRVAGEADQERGSDGSGPESS